MTTVFHILPDWEESALHDVLTEAFSTPWTPRQLAIMSSTEGAETVSEAVERVRRANLSMLQDDDSCSTSNEGEAAVAGSSDDSVTQRHASSIRVAIPVTAIAPPPASPRPVRRSSSGNPHSPPIIDTTVYDAAARKHSNGVASPSCSGNLLDLVPCRLSGASRSSQDAGAGCIGAPQLAMGAGSVSAGDMPDMLGHEVPIQHARDKYPSISRGSSAVSNLLAAGPAAAAAIAAAIMPAPASGDPGLGDPSQQWRCEEESMSYLDASWDPFGGWSGSTPHQTAVPSNNHTGSSTVHHPITGALQTALEEDEVINSVLVV